MNQPRKKRRLFSFSLRSLLIVMLLLACLFGWIGIRYRRMKEQRAILESIKTEGGIVYIGKVECKPSSGDLFYDGNYIHRIDRFIDASYFHSSWTDLSPLTKLKNLKYVYVVNQYVSYHNRGIRQWPPIKLIDLAPLSGLKNLEVLSMERVDVSDLSPLSELKNLKQLNVNHTQVSDITPLVGLKNLRELYLRNTDVTDLKPLAGLKNLKVLEISNYQVSDLKPLSQLKGLQELYLDVRQVIDFTPLIELNNLKTLVIDSTVEVKDLDQLKKALPNCKITVR